MSLFTLGIAFSFAWGGGLAYADPPQWAPAHGYHGKKYKKYKKHKHKHHKHKKYSYVYYPNNQVYYSPVRRGYYYPYRGNWVFNVNLPNSIRLGRAVSIELGGPTPYAYHPTVINQYPVVVVND